MQKRALAQFSDPGKEAAVAGSIATGLFARLSAADLIPPEAFTEPHWRQLYTSARRLLQQGKTVTANGVNKHIAFIGCEREIADFVGAAATTWQEWPILANVTLGTSLVLRDYLQTIAEKYRQRRAREISVGLESTNLSLEDAHQALGDLLHQANGADDPSGGKFTMLTVSQILAYQDNPDDILLSNGYLERGSPCVLCGPPGIGKSRLALQLAIKSILGLGFLGWETNAQGMKWAFLQNENGLRRLKANLGAMCKSLARHEMEALENGLLIHAIVNNWDGHWTSLTWTPASASWR